MSSLIFRSAPHFKKSHCEFSFYCEDQVCHTCRTASKQQTRTTKDVQQSGSKDSPNLTHLIAPRIYENSIRTSQETLRLRYEDQPVNNVQGKQSLFIMRIIWNTQILSIGRMQSFSVLKRVMHMVTTGL
jgi:hypothetical protein